MTVQNQHGSGANRHMAPSLAEVIEDHALEAVPPAERKSGWSLAWMTVGIITTLAQLLIGGLVTALAGVVRGVIAGVIVAIYGAVLGWLVAHIAHREGTSSTLTSRLHGFGVRGSSLTSGIFAFALVTFLALENVLLYNGIRFTFHLTDTWGSRIAIYGVLTACWVLLSLFGIALIQRVSSALTILFLLLLGYLIFRAGWQSGTPITTTLGHRPLVSGSASDQFQSAVVLLAGPVGALSLAAADYARYARSSRDVAILATAGAVVVDVLVVLAGTVVVFGGAGLASTYLIRHGLATPHSAISQVTALSQSNTGAYFIILSTIAGFVLMLAAQGKAQVLNTYSISLAFANLFDSLTPWRIGRAAMVALANALSLAIVAGGVLTQLQDWIGAVGVVVTGFAAVMIADYYLVGRRTGASRSEIEDINWAGVLSVSAASVSGIVLETLDIFRMGFLLALAMGILLYPVLRLWVLRPGTFTHWHAESSRT
jgi:cytosine permease